MLFCISWQLFRDFLFHFSSHPFSLDAFLTRHTWSFPLSHIVFVDITVVSKLFISEDFTCWICNSLSWLSLKLARIAEIRHNVCCHPFYIILLFVLVYRDWHRRILRLWVQFECRERTKGNSQDTFQKCKFFFHSF